MGSEELAYRQAIRHVESCLTFGGGVRRNQRKTFEQFFNHSNPRVREYVQRLKNEMDAERARSHTLEMQESADAERLETIFNDLCDEPDYVESDAEIFL